MVEFPSFEAAKECYDLELYRAAKAKREGAADMQIILVEGA